ncbi:MAG: dTDP-4-dehydrorhamnose 3,5-epimerase [Ignavibacteriae bacterium]|nr:dTDP-4-dehydrorhamnose 3,5-epimerase [Ignavibacteriota bacterium]MCB9210541.1 dTDP-4-dehydrorhamnose 3,5-epimerase [Ignavibacteriales bacterium]MCB9257747.1 dTDP-4-dehydrorhamnose 3,5-epimerase [Ignavibacteriales bacterium]
MLKKIETPLPDLFIIEPQVFHDSRGFFFEGFSEQKYNDIGISEKFVQDNFSKSSFGTIRGLHYQVGEFAQGKLCHVLEGKVLDVAVDIRFGSPTFGQYFSAELSSENKKQLWIPPGFAHGFSVLSEEAIFHYKCTNYYSKKDERCIIYNDLQISINWDIKNPIISDKDKLGIEFNKIEKDFLYKI